MEIRKITAAVEMRQLRRRRKSPSYHPAPLCKTHFEDGSKSRGSQETSTFQKLQRQTWSCVLGPRRPVLGPVLVLVLGPVLVPGPGPGLGLGPWLQVPSCLPQTAAPRGIASRDLDFLRAAAGRPPPPCGSPSSSAAMARALGCAPARALCRRGGLPGTPRVSGCTTRRRAPARPRLPATWQPRLHAHA